MWESILSDSIGLFGPRLSSDLGALGIFLGHVSARFFVNLNCFISNFSNCTNFQKNLSNWFPKYFTWMIDLKYFISPSSWFQICKTCILYIHVRPNVVVLNSNIPPVGQKLHQSVLWQVHTDRIPGGSGKDFELWWKSTDCNTKNSFYFEKYVALQPHGWYFAQSPQKML